MFLAILSLAAVAVAAPHSPRQHFVQPWGQPHECRGCNLVGKAWAESPYFVSPWDITMEDFIQHVPTYHKRATAKVEDDKCVILIPLTGIEEGDIAVRATQNFMAMKAISSNELNGVYTCFSLPKNVDSAGTWTYHDGVLKIVLHLKE